MTSKQRRALEQYILRRADLIDLQAIEKMCAMRRGAILRTVGVMEAREKCVRVAIKDAGALIR